jgi:hypothetical protein
MHKNTKNEIGQVYGDFKVLAITNMREPSNGCVIWKCECTRCNTIHHCNGNLLRFGHIKYCPICNRHGHKRR